MLRLKHVSINPACIDFIRIHSKEVIIGVELLNPEVPVFRDPPPPQPIVVTLKTEEDAIYFAEYVELLVDITNKEAAGYRKDAIRNFELYFANYLRPKEIWEDVRQEVQEHLNKRQKAK